MKTARFLALAVVLTGAFCAVFADDAVTPPKLQYVKVTEAFPIVYATLDPKSDIIGQPVKKGTYLELLRKGETGSWYEVKYDGRIGYLEAKAGVVTDKKGQGAMLFIFIIMILCCAGGVVLYIKKQQITPSTTAANDEDLD